MHVDVQKGQKMQVTLSSWYSRIRAVEEMSKCSHLLLEGEVKDKSIRKLLSRSGGPETCNICHSALLLFLNDNREKGGRAVLS